MKDDLELEIERMKERIFRKVAVRLRGSWVSASLPPELDRSDQRLPQSKSSGPVGDPDEMGGTPTTPIAAPPQTVS